MNKRKKKAKAAAKPKAQAKPKRVPTALELALDFGAALIMDYSKREGANLEGLVKNAITIGIVIGARGGAGDLLGGRDLEKLGSPLIQ